MKSINKPKQQPKPITKKPSFIAESKKNPPTKISQKLSEADLAPQEKIQDSITESMRSTPSTAQMLANFPTLLSFQSHDLTCRSPEENKTNSPVRTRPSASPINIQSVNKEKIVRKDSRSLTTVNTPDKVIGSNNFNEAANSAKRRIQRMKTEVHNLNSSKNSQFYHNYSNSLSNNYNNEKTPSRVMQKEKDLQRSEILVQDIKFKEENTEKFEPESTPSKSFYLKNGRRFSVASNASFNSLMLSEAHYEILADLTKSVKELNQRLIKSEEVTYERLKENLALKSKIANLESKIDEQKNKRLDTEVLNPGCTASCLVF